ncbi:hypothetical protein BDZ91DRAFT_716069 [Kalaharituber pfeilii]|nr:hypothetical protein BDZ91DRAFT_716069 [Kalaharituber pfeilii]
MEKRRPNTSGPGERYSGRGSEGGLEVIRRLTASKKDEPDALVELIKKGSGGVRETT